MYAKLVFLALLAAASAAKFGTFFLFSHITSLYKVNFKLLFKEFKNFFWHLMNLNKMKELTPGMIYIKSSGKSSFRFKL